MRRSITYSEWFINLTATLAVFFFLAYFRLLRIQYDFHPEFLNLERSKVIFGFWHGRQFLLIPSFSHLHAVVMSDLSWAGEIQSKILSRLGYLVVRGSSKRKGTQALIQMKKVMENGHPGAFALDGPSGPVYQSKPGILFLAKKLGYPIVPVAASAERAWVLTKTWCHYLIPKPFSFCYVSMGKPVILTTAQGEITTHELDRILANWTKKADLTVQQSH
ncbi:DUF374 domain-containing protein [bacterium]|nr:DUF374 domain-containing protein [bacterium]